MQRLHFGAVKMIALILPFNDPKIAHGTVDGIGSDTEMVTRYGMAETLGPRTYARPPQPFLTGTTADRVVASEATEREIDIAVRDIVVKAFDRATEVLRKRHLARRRTL